MQFLKYTLLVLSMTLSSLSWSGWPPMPNALPSLAPLVERLNPSVVSVAVIMTQQGRGYSQSGGGSGVIIDAQKGLVVSNAHVVEGGQKISVTLSDGRQLPATLIGVDTDVDIALLKITADNLVAMPMADSSMLRVGDFVLALGHPFGLGQSLTTGVVSGLGRTNLGIEGYENFIQTDAAINPGNSGGALVNLNGQLVGINTAIFAPSGGSVGIGFAIPINMAQASISQLLEFGYVQRGRLGVAIETLAPQHNQRLNLPDDQQGVLITRVQRGSAAALAGLQAGDVITSVSGEPTNTAGKLRTRIGLTRPNKPVDITYLRRGEEKHVEIKLQGGESQQAALKGSVFAGVTFEPQRLTIIAIDADSVAAKHGLDIGDVIVSVNNRRVYSVSDLQIMLGWSQQEAAVIQVLRGNSLYQLVLRE